MNTGYRHAVELCSDASDSLSSEEGDVRNRIHTALVRLCPWDLGHFPAGVSQRTLKAINAKFVREEGYLDQLNRMPDGEVQELIALLRRLHDSVIEIAARTSAA